MAMSYKISSIQLDCESSTCQKLKSILASSGTPPTAFSCMNVVQKKNKNLGISRPKSKENLQRQDVTSSFLPKENEPRSCRPSKSEIRPLFRLIYRQNLRLKQRFRGQLRIQMPCLYVAPYVDVNLECFLNVNFRQCM